MNQLKNNRESEFKGFTVKVGNKFSSINAQISYVGELHDYE